MFGTLRLQLTLWYVGALAVTLVVVGALVYWLVARSLDQQIDDSLREVNQLAAQVLQQAPPPPDGDSSGPGGDDDHGGADEEDEYTAALADRLLGGTGDVIPLVLDDDGLVLSNPRNLALDELPLDDAVAGARADGSNEREATIDGNHVRILTQEVKDSAGDDAGFVITLKSLEQRDEDLQRLLVLLAIGGGVGLVLAGAGGLWVAQLAIRPVRRAFERQRDFVADASHELRTPLAVVRANAESLLGKAPDHEREPLQDIVDESALMGRLVNDLLTLAQSDRATLELEREHVDLFDVVQTAERAGRRLAQERDVAVTARAEHVALDADPERLRQLLLILVDNAVRYTPAGGSVTVSGSRRGKQAEITVEDTGIGMAPEHVGRVFDRFYRVDKARSRAEGGLGLGLSIAREIAEAHGGSIEVRSEAGRGTTVRVVLPAEPSPAAETAPESAAPEPGG